MSKNAAMICAGIGVVVLIAVLLLAPNGEGEFGVYIGADPEDLAGRDLSDTIVIDAQYYTEKDIADLKADGHTVYTYINLGSVESFRDYYKEYEPITLGPYENWEDERWVDVSDLRWQAFISAKADELISKGIDGFFVDNCDAYYNFPSDDIFEGVSAILTNFKEKDVYVMVNGGDTFVREYLKRYRNLDEILDGVNQECVYTSIDWENKSFLVNNPEEREYFLEYLRLVMDAGKDPYAIEYTTDARIASKARELAASSGYTVYIAPSISLE